MLLQADIIEFEHGFLWFVKLPERDRGSKSWHWMCRVPAYIVEKLPARRELGHGAYLVQLIKLL